MKFYYWILAKTILNFICIEAQEPVATTNKPPIQSRRIINGFESKEDKNYMVYLKYARGARDRWLCGGVIVHEEYIITSAACIEDVKHFYVVSGTFKYEEGRASPCIKKGAKRAVWKCIPKNYAFNNKDPAIDWLNNDIAVVKIEDGFDFKRKVKGCDFIPRPLPYNNQSMSLEAPGNTATIAGWGTRIKYGEQNQPQLLETKVEIISKPRCTRRWGGMYTKIIENYMICTKDIGQSMSEVCKEKYVECQDMSYADYEDGRRVEKVDQVPTNLFVKAGNDNRSKLFLNGSEHNERRFNRKNEGPDGGFCENDHGGPIVYGCAPDEIVIGIMSACLVKARTERCYGPFLYTSIYKNKEFVNCAIYKSVEPCRRQFRAGFTYEEHEMSWHDFDNETDNGVAERVRAPAKITALRTMDLPEDQPDEPVIRAQPIPNPELNKAEIKERIEPIADDKENLKEENDDIQIHPNVSLRASFNTSNSIHIL